MNLSNVKQSGDNPAQKTGPIDKPYQRICVPIDFVTKYFADATFPLTINLIVEADGKVIHGNQPTHITRNHNGAGRPYYFIRKLADVVSKSGLGRPQKFLWHLEPQQTIRVCLVACNPRDGDAGGVGGAGVGAAGADDDDQPSGKKARQGNGHVPDSPSHQPGSSHRGNDTRNGQPPLALPSALGGSSLAPNPPSWSNQRPVGNFMVVPGQAPPYDDARYPPSSLSMTSFHDPRYSLPLSISAAQDSRYPPPSSIVPLGYPPPASSDPHLRPNTTAPPGGSLTRSMPPLPSGLQAINTQPNGVYPTGGHLQEGGTPRSSGGGGAGGASVGRSLLTRLEMEITIVLRELVAGNVGVEDLRHCMGVMAEQWAAAVDEAEKLRSDLAATRRSLDHTESALGRAQEHMSHQDSCTPANPAVSLATEHLVKALQMLDPTALVTLGTHSDAHAQQQ